MCVRVGKEGLVEAPDPINTSLVAPTMPGARKTVRCTVAQKPGDVVSAAAYSWGPAVAREHGDRGGRNDDIRIEGTVVEAKDSKWVCDFGDETNIAWKRTELRFVSRPGEEAEAARRGSKRSRPAPRLDSSDEEEATAEPEPTAGSDSSEVDDPGADGAGPVGRSNHAKPMPEAGLVAGAQWV